MIFFILFLSIPIIEIYLFIKISEFIGSLYTIVLIIFTALGGGALIKKEGIKTLNHIKLTSFNEPKQLIKALGDGFFIVVSGILLITPGFITDLLGLALLFRKTRVILIEFFIIKFSSNYHK